MGRLRSQSNRSGCKNSFWDKSHSEKEGSEAVNILSVVTLTRNPC